MNKTQALNYVDLIIKDIQDRQGIGDEWDQINKNIQKEIKNAWIKILLK